jgi:hypothetical protein
LARTRAVEPINSSVKDATVRAFHYETLESLKAHLDGFTTAYNFAKHLKSLRCRTRSKPSAMPARKTPIPFIINPHHLIPGLDI